MPVRCAELREVDELKRIIRHLLISNFLIQDMNNQGKTVISSPQFC